MAIPPQIRPYIPRRRKWRRRGPRSPEYLDLVHSDPTLHGDDHSEYSQFPAFSNPNGQTVININLGRFEKLFKDRQASESGSNPFLRKLSQGKICKTVFTTVALCALGRTTFTIPYIRKYSYVFRIAPNRKSVSQ